MDKVTIPEKFNQCKIEIFIEMKYIIDVKYYGFQGAPGSPFLPGCPGQSMSLLE